jgi:dipeptidyl aminopeptidase/acylaminoacyl peptidase
MVSGPTRRTSLVLVIAASAAALAGCSDDSDGPSVDSLEVVDTQVLDLPFSDAFLSPNGERIATYAEEELCVYSSAGEEERCVDEEVEVDPNSIEWAADGSRLAFTENFYQYFHDPDVWTLDADSGELTNLTDDGVDEGGLDIQADDSDADIDVSPVWMDDSTVRFLRWHRDEETVEVLEVAADGGDPEQVGSLATSTAPGTIAYSPDGEQVAYLRYEDEEDLVLADLAGEDVTTVADGTTFAASFSADGEHVLAAPLGVMYAPSEAPPALVVPTDGGDPTELGESVFWAAWRAEGDGLLVAEQLGPGEDPTEMSLQLTDDGSDEGREVTTGPFVPPFRQASWRLPVWSTQDTVLLMRRSEEAESGFEYVLVQLGEE